MFQPTALVETASEFTEDAWVTPEDDQMWPEDFYSADYPDDDPYDGGEDAYLDSYWESLCEM